MDILADCIDSMQSLADWFTDLDMDDPALSDMRRSAYEAIRSSVLSVALGDNFEASVDPKLSPAESAVLSMLIHYPIAIAAADRNILLTCVHELAHNSNQTLSEMIRVEVFIDNKDLQEKNAAYLHDDHGFKQHQSFLDAVAFDTPNIY